MYLNITEDFEDIFQKMATQWRNRAHTTRMPPPPKSQEPSHKDMELLRVLRRKQRKCPRNVETLTLTTWLCPGSHPQNRHLKSPLNHAEELFQGTLVQDLFIIKRRKIKKLFVIINCNLQSIPVLESMKYKVLLQLPNIYNNLENEYWRKDVIPYG